MIKKLFGLCFCLFAMTLNAQVTKTHEIRAVVFDFGGVIASVDKSLMVNFLLESFQVSKKELFLALKDMQTYVAEGGSEEQFWQQYALSKGISLPDDWFGQFGDVIKHSIDLIPGTLEIAKSLKAQGVQIAILSDITQYQASLVRRLGYYDIFDPVILSCEIGVNKPSPKAFLILLETLNLPPSSVFFTDDNEENVAAARNLGIDAVRFINPNQLQKELEKRGKGLSRCLITCRPYGS